MRIKTAEHVKILTTRVSETLDNFIVNYCTKNNNSKSEFVRDAVEHYINYLKSKANEQLLQQELAEGISEFDKVFNDKFFN